MTRQRTIGKMFPLLLVFLLLYNSIGFIIVHIYRVSELKSAMFESIKTNSFNQNLTLLIFSKDELNCERPVINRIDEKEFRYEGKYYDIVKEEVKGDKIYFYCLHDKEENLLDFIFVKQFEKQNDENSSERLLTKSMFKFLPDYLLNEKNIRPENYQRKIFQVFPETLIPLNFTEILTPPPQNFNLNLTWNTI